MYIEPKTLIVNRSDLYLQVRKKHIKDIFPTDLKDSLKPYQKNAIVLFVDNNGQTKLLKNKYGDCGEGMYNEIISEIMQECSDQISVSKKRI